MHAHTATFAKHSDHIFFLLTVLASLILSIFGGLGLGRLFHRWRSRASSSFAEIIFGLLESVTLPLLVLLTLYVVMEVLTPPPRYERIGSKLALALVIIVFFFFLAKAIGVVLQHLGQRDPALVRVTQPATFVMRLLFALLAIIIVLENLGIHLTAIWTTLGVGSVAVALALQETLSNVFAGLYLMADRPVSVGDYVKLDSGHEGHVVQVGWRATSLRTLTNNVVFVPNSSLAKAIITNYSVPDERVALSIQVGVAYGTDPQKVETALFDVAKQAAKDGLEGFLDTPAPTVRLIPGFGDSTLNFTLNFSVRRFVDQYLVQSELRKRIIQRFADDGIDMPFPTRTILLDKSVLESLDKLKGPSRE
jgi:small-conductance mechanosensitive channel